MVMNQANDDDCDDNKNVCWAACVYKNQSNCDKLITNCSREANPKKSRKISKRSGDENIGLILSRKIPGFCKNPVPKIPGLKFLRTLGPGCHDTVAQAEWILKNWRLRCRLVMAYGWHLITIAFAKSPWRSWNLPSWQTVRDVCVLHQLIQWKEI